MFISFFPNQSQDISISSRTNMVQRNPRDVSREIDVYQLFFRITLRKFNSSRTNMVQRNQSDILTELDQLFPNHPWEIQCIPHKYDSRKSKKQKNCTFCQHHNHHHENHIYLKNCTFSICMHISPSSIVYVASYSNNYHENDNYFPNVVQYILRYISQSHFFTTFLSTPLRKWSSARAHSSCSAGSAPPYFFSSK